MCRGKNQQTKTNKTSADKNVPVRAYLPPVWSLTLVANQPAEGCLKTVRARAHLPPDWSRSQGVGEKPVVTPCRRIATTPPDRGRKGPSRRSGVGMHPSPGRRGDQVRDCLHSKYLAVVLNIGPSLPAQDPSNLHGLNARERGRTSPRQVQDSMSALRIHPIVFNNKFITPAINTPSYPSARKFIGMRWPARYTARRK